MQDAQHIKQLKVAKVKCLSSLLFSTRYFFKHLQKRKFIVRKHHIAISEALERVLSGKCKRLLISVPPRYGKTELAVKHFMANGLALNPAAKFIHLSATDALALDNSEGCKDIVNSPEYRQMFPEVRIKQSTDSKKKWYTDAGGGVYATGAAGQVTGFGAGQSGDDVAEWLDEVLSNIDTKQTFGGALIIDDPIKPDDADADIKRERVNRRWSSTIKSRLNSRDTPVIVIMQRLHPQDLIGYLKETEPGEWEELSLPALFVNESGELEALDPSKHTVEDLQAMESNRSEEVRIAFQRQYMQNPKPREGLCFPDTDLRYADMTDIEALRQLSEFRFGYTDPADKGGDDLCTIVAYLIGKLIYVVDVLYNTKGTDYNIPANVKLFVNHDVNAGEIESNGAWILFGKSVRTEVQKHRPNCSIRLFPNVSNKHTRILSQRSNILGNMVFRSDWQTYNPEYRKFMENLTSYREDQSGANKNAHDDAPDACAGVSNYFASKFKHLFELS
jgi:predicted phage terminase large subunit-like protein